MTRGARLELMAHPLGLRVTGPDGKVTTWPLSAAQGIDTGTALIAASRAAQERKGGSMKGEDFGRWSGGEFHTLGEQLTAVVAAEVSGFPDPRLGRVARLASGLNEAVGSEGGFLVQSDFSTQLLGAAMEASLLVPRCTRIPISNPSNSVKVPVVNETSRADGSRWGGIQMYWKDEAAEKTATKPGFRVVELSLKKLIGLCYVTDELLQDAAALEAYIRAAFAAEAAFKLDDSVLRGPGGGLPLGILNSPCLVTVAKETGQAAATINPNNIVKMFSRMYAGGVANSVWLVNQDVFPQLYLLGQTIGTNGVPVYQPEGRIAGVPYSTLFGRPLLHCEQCSSLGTVGDVIYGDFTQFLAAVKGGAGLEAAASAHVRWIHDETCFRFVYRFSGCPAWSAALTPYQGVNTVSPFIALQTRD